jgi:hypothetical protein
MTKIYCVKCREFTDTKSEKFVTTKNDRTRLTGICKACGTKKGMFVSKDRTFIPKTEDELEEARFKRATSSVKKKALAIGYKALYDKDTTKCVIDCLPEHIRPKNRREKNKD